MGSAYDPFKPHEIRDEDFGWVRIWMGTQPLHVSKEMVRDAVMMALPIPPGSRLPGFVEMGRHAAPRDVVDGPSWRREPTPKPSRRPQLASVG
jgi:hypothetical protein